MTMTVELDPDVADALSRIHEAQHVDVKALVNDLVRNAIRGKDPHVPPTKKEPFRTKVVDLGRPLLDVTNAQEALAIAEGESRK